MNDDSKPAGESLQDFFASFSYGSRTDLNFKFLKSMSEEAAAEFIQQLLWKLGDTLNDGDLNRLAAYVARAQQAAYAGSGERYSYSDGPFMKPGKSAREMNVAVISSSGHFVEGDDPKPFGVTGMSQDEAIERIGEFLKNPPTLSTIPIDTSSQNLRVRHGGYDIRAGALDHNVALPIDPLKQLAADGRIGKLHANAYSFVGACAQGRMINHTGPEWADKFTGEEIDAIVLVPV
jgi:hypothetical protein